MKKRNLNFLLTLPLVCFAFACSGSGSGAGVGGGADTTTVPPPNVTVTQQAQTPPTPPAVAHINFLDSYTDQYISYLDPNISTDKRENLTQVIKSVWNRRLVGVDVTNFQKNTDNLRNFFLFVYKTDASLQNDLDSLDAQIMNVRMDLKTAVSTRGQGVLWALNPMSNHLSTLITSLNEVQQKIKAIADIYHIEMTIPETSDASFKTLQDKFSNGIMNQMEGVIFNPLIAHDPMYLKTAGNLNTLLGSVSFCYKDAEGNDSSVSFVTFDLPKGQTLTPGTGKELPSGAVFGGFETGDVDLSPAD